MASLKGRRRGAGASPEDRGKGSELKDKLDARAYSCKRTNRTVRLATGQLDSSQSSREESETADLTGYLGGRSQKGPLPPEVDVAESRQCAAKRPARHAAEQGQRHARGGSTGCHNRSRPRTVGGGITLPPTLAGQASASGVYPEGQQQTATAGDSNHTRPLPTSDGQECVGARMGGSF